MAYFAFDFRDSHKQTRLNLIPSLLTQLAAQSDLCSDKLSRLYSIHNPGGRMPTGADLEDCLIDMVSLPNQGHVYIIIDAIDECPDAPGVPSPREEVLELLEKLIKLHLPNLRLCVTSRHERDIQAVLEPLSSFSISLHDESGQKQDISNYIKDVVHADQNMRRWSAKDQDLVIQTLSERADGMSGPCCAPYCVAHIIYQVGSVGCPASWIY
jgi:NACHT domain